MQESEEWLEGPAETFPLKKVSDYFDLNGIHFLSQADRYSVWLTVNKVKSINFSELAEILRKMFIWHGVPYLMAMDGGPLFSGEAFKQFCSKRQIKH